MERKWRQIIICKLKWHSENVKAKEFILNPSISFHIAVQLFVLYIQPKNTWW